MACFIVTLVEAAVVKVAEKKIEKKELLALEDKKEDVEIKATIPMSSKLRWLSRMLFGGAVLLAFEHLWHGEISPVFPFLTAMSDSESAIEMLKEMGTVGVSMSVLVTAIWGCMCKVADSIVKRPVSQTVSDSEKTS